MEPSGQVRIFMASHPNIMTRVGIVDNSDLILKSLETEPVKNLLGPVTKQLGLIGDDIGSIVRFYINQNLQRVFTRWAEDRQNRPLPFDTDLGRLLPLIQLASMQSDEELQERWAALLDRAVTAPDTVHPSFGQTLSQITAQEARYIERLYEYLMERRSSKRQDDLCDIGDENMLRGIFDERLRVMTYAEAQTRKKESEAAQLAIDDLQRLGIIAHRQEPGKLNLGDRDLLSVQSLSLKVQDMEFESIYSFTEYGLKFVRAVKPAPTIEKKAGFGR